MNQFKSALKSIGKVKWFRIIIVITTLIFIGISFYHIFDWNASLFSENAVLALIGLIILKQEFMQDEIKTLKNKLKNGGY